MEPTFFEEPLERDLYVPKKNLSEAKVPLRILITDAGGKIAYNTIYELCSGNVFGYDQEVIIHLINSRGSMPHKSIILELEECGFSACKDFVVSSNPEVAYKDVDIVINISTYEEIPGRSISNALIYQVVKARQTAMNALQYAKSDCKIVFAGPSTKAITTLLGAFQKFAPQFPRNNVTSATALDVIISKNLLAAKLNTTTTQIKNVVIWASTFPDIQNATVHMYPANDRGKWEKKDIPIAEAIDDEIWLFTKFPLSIYRRLMNPDLLKYGKAVTMGLREHLRYLFKGTEAYDEILSMAVIAPPEKVYGVPPDCGFSLPVKTKNGQWDILQNVKYNTATHLNMIRAIFNYNHSILMNSIMKVVTYMLNYEETKKEVVKLHNRHFIEEVIETQNWITRYFVTPSPAEKVAKFRNKLRESKKSIAWDDESNVSRRKLAVDKSAIRFSVERADLKKMDAHFRKKSMFSNQTDDLGSILDGLSGKSIEKI